MITDDGNAQSGESEDLPPAELKDLAALAVLLHTKQPVDGERPTEAEIWAWMHNGLSDERSAEVKSHVARDPDIYRLWHSLRAASQEFPSQQMAGLSETAPRESSVSDGRSISIADSVNTFFQKVSNFIKPSPFLGFATAATLCVIVVVAIQNNEPPPDFWQDWQMPKSQIVSKSLGDQMAFQSVLAGMNAKMRELSLPTLAPDGTRLPTDTPTCEQVSEDVPCTQTRQALYLLGQLVTETRLVCSTSYPIPEEKRERVQGITDQLTGQLEGRPFAGPLEQWLESDERSQQCAAVNTIINRALRGLSS